MSGGPVLAIRETRGILSLPLAAVISEGDASTDTIAAERADRILANGDIRISAGRRPIGSGQLFRHLVGAGQMFRRAGTDNVGSVWATLA